MGRKARLKKREVREVTAARSGKEVSFPWRPLIVVSLILLTALVFAPLQNAAFISLDDPQYVTNNPEVLRGLTWSGIRWAATSLYAANWHPLTWLSHMADVEMFGLDAGSHHLVNIFLHTASVVFLFLFCAKATSTIWRSAIVAALFAIHPLHVESVAWVAERKDVLSTLFFILALYAYAAYVADRRLIKLVAVYACFLMGLSAKPMVITLPLVLLMLDYWPLSRLPVASGKAIGSWWPLLKEKLPMFGISLGSALITLIAQRKGAAVIAVASLGFVQRIGSAFSSYLIYLADTFWPARLAVFYPFKAPSIVWSIVSIIIVSAITVIAFLRARKMPFVIVGWLWFLITLVPVIGLVQVGAQARADRYMYIPSIGIFIAIVWTAYTLVEKWKDARLPVAAAGAAAIVACAIVTSRQVKHWHDDLSLWSHAVEVTSDNYRAEDHLGVALTDRGMLEQGIQHYQAALRIWPDYPEGHNNLGAAYMDQKRYNDAVAEFSAAAKVKPRDVNFRYNLAVALDAAGDRNAAIAQVKTGLAIDPTFPSLVQAAEVFGISTARK
jgi:hypothetical protein